MPARLLATLALCFFPLAAFAQTYPSKPIRIVVPYPPGGGVDVVGRLLAAYLPERLKQPVIVENRGGAGGNIGADHVAKSAPDGYTFLLQTVAHAIAPSLYRRLPFDPVKDFTPVTQVLRTTLVLVVPLRLQAANVKELVALAKASPGKMNYGSTGAANALHLAMELLKLQTGTDIVAIPYAGDGPMYTALLGGQLDVAILPLSSAVAPLKAGKIRALGVTTPARAAALPDVPAVGESIPGYQSASWQALFAPAKTPREAVARFQRETAEVMKRPEIVAKFAGFGGEPVGSTPEEFEAFYREDVARFAKIVKAAGIPPQD